MKKPVAEVKQGRKETSIDLYQSYRMGLTREAVIRFDAYVLGALVSGSDYERVQKCCEGAIGNMRRAG
jgi:hypothetical protein